MEKKYSPTTRESGVRQGAIDISGCGKVWNGNLRRRRVLQASRVDFQAFSGRAVKGWDLVESGVYFGAGRFLNHLGKNTQKKKLKIYKVYVVNSGGAAFTRLRK